MGLPGYTKSEEASEYLLRAACREHNRHPTSDQAKKLFNAAGVNINYTNLHSYLFKFVPEMLKKFPKYMEQQHGAAYSIIDFLSAINKGDYQKALELTLDMPGYVGSFGFFYMQRDNKKT